MTVAPSLRRYLEEQVLPRYRDCDAAHDLRHIEAVIENSLEIARELRGRYALDIDMVYAVAAYHDIGIPQGRADHHLTSAAALRADCRLRQWFSPPQIETMAQAVEDHRASAKERPRSIYGEIVSEADRTLDPETVVRRTVLYGLDHCPQLDFDGQYARAWEHLRGKYGPGGYVKMWLRTGKNTRDLEALRQLLDDAPRLKQMCRQFYDTAKKEDPRR
nr:HD domain-containing protein [Neobittarella massiliensis]